MLKYLLTFRKIEALNEPVIDYLKNYTQNQSLLDIIAQHFFQDTPTFFALSYFKLYLDYNYPRGGTGKLPEKLIAFIEAHNGTIKTNTKIVAVDPEKRVVTDSQGQTHGYRQLIWAADLKTLYQQMDPDTISDSNIQSAVRERRAAVADKAGGIRFSRSTWRWTWTKATSPPVPASISFIHHTGEGQSSVGPVPIGESRDDIEAWLEKFFTLTTYEISCPVMRDVTMAPPGKTGLIVSVLFDYKLTKYVEDAGWYNAFKTLR